MAAGNAGLGRFSRENNPHILEVKVFCHGDQPFFLFARILIVGPDSNRIGGFVLGRRVLLGSHDRGLCSFFV